MGKITNNLEKENVWPVNKPMKKFSTSLNIKEMEIQTTMSYQQTPSRMVEVQTEL